MSIQNEEQNLATADAIALIALEVEDEVRRAISLHKGINSLHEAKAVIEEELDEFWELVKQNPKKLNSAEQVDRMRGLREELIQTAAMCVRAIHDLHL